MATSATDTSDTYLSDMALKSHRMKIRVWPFENGFLSASMLGPSRYSSRMNVSTVAAKVAMC